MSSALALVVTTVVVLVLFHLIDFCAWGNAWVRREVYPRIPKEVWRCGETDAGRRRALLLSALVTTFVAIVFVPMVWMLGPRFAGARVVLLALLLWAVFDLPGALYTGIFYRLPSAYVKIQALAGLARVLVGLAAVTWLLTVFNAW